MEGSTHNEERQGPRTRVLVAGSTGYLGRHLVKALHAQGHWVRALVRDPSRLGDAEGAVDEVFVGQATDDATLAGVADGVDAVISCLGNRTFKRRPSVWEVDRDANLNLVQRSREANVSQFVFVSVLDGRRMRTRVPQIAAREQVVEALEDVGVPWTIIRPSGFFNDMLEFLDMATRGTAWMIGDGTSKFNPIHGADLAAFIVDRLGDAGAIGQEYPVGGPETFSQRDVATAAFSALGVPPKIRTTPAWLVPWLARMLIPFNVNFGSFLAMLGAMAGERDATAPATGTHRLADFFCDHAGAKTSDLRARR